MDRVFELRKRASQNLEKAEHLTHTLYPSLEDPKLLLAAVENIFLSMSNSLGALLHYELKFNRIPLFKDDFEGKYEVFSRRVSLRYGFDKSYAHFLLRLKEIILKHRESNTEFSRKKEFVIYDEDFSNKESISHSKTMMYLDKAKEFHQKVYEITDTDEHIFGMRSKFKKDEKKRGFFRR